MTGDTFRNHIVGVTTNVLRIQHGHENREQRHRSGDVCHGDHLDPARTKPRIPQRFHGRRLSLDNLWRDLGRSRYRTGDLEQHPADQVLSNAAIT